MNFMTDTRLTQRTAGLFLAVVVSSLLVLTPVALQADAGDCQTVPSTGQCVGSVLSYCVDVNTANEQVVTVDCNGQVFPSDISGLCITVNTGYGADCAVPEGERCLFTGDQNQTVVAFCGGSNAGCVIDESDHSSLCVAELGTCQPPAQGETFASSCVDDVLIVACQAGQPTGLDCLGLGGSCSGGACVDLGEDSECDDQRLCASGLECHPQLKVCIDSQAHCDPDTAQATCSDDDLRYCSTPHNLWRDVSCADTLGSRSGMTCGPAYNCVDDGSSGACQQVPVGCIGDSTGDGCSVEQGFYCSSGLGCVLGLVNDANEESCRPTADCAFGEQHKGCVGDIATFCITDQQRSVVEAAGVDCASLGSTCVEDVTLGPICRGGLGARCDDPELLPESPFRCEAGLVCVMDGNNFGTCAEPADAGVPDAVAEDVVAVADVWADDAVAADAGFADSNTGDSSMDDATAWDTAVIDSRAGGDKDKDGNAPVESGCGCSQRSVWSGFSSVLLLAAVALISRRWSR